MSAALDCSVIVPVLDERESIEPLIAQIVEAFATLDGSFEIIVVDDGSCDGPGMRSLPPPASMYRRSLVANFQEQCADKSDN